MASSLILKKKPSFPNLLTGLQFRQSVSTNSLTSSGHTFRQPRISTISFVPSSNVAVSNQFNSTFRPASSFRTSVVLSRSIVPLRRPSVTTTGALISRYINCKEFHVDISGNNDSGVAWVKKTLRDKLDPLGWWYLVFKLDEDNLIHFETKKTLVRTKCIETDEGVCLRMQMPGAEYSQMKVSVEDNTLMCKDIREGLRKTHNFNFELPKKTYQPSDVKSKIENGILWVTFTNLKMEELKAME